jgi:hypothetical protein
MRTMRAGDTASKARILHKSRANQQFSPTDMRTPLRGRYQLLREDADEDCMIAPLRE